MKNEFVIKKVVAAVIATVAVAAPAVAQVGFSSSLTSFDFGSSYQGTFEFPAGSGNYYGAGSTGFDLTSLTVLTQRNLHRSCR